MPRSFDPGDLLQQRPGRIAEEGACRPRAGWAGALHGPVPQADELAVGEGGPAELDGKQMGVYRATEELYYAVELRCPHLGCRLEWNPDDKSWDCPCHGSRFDVQGPLPDGARADGPARLLQEKKLKASGKWIVESCARLPATLCKGEGQPGPAARCRFVPASVKTVTADCVSVAACPFFTARPVQEYSTAYAALVHLPHPFRCVIPRSEAIWESRSTWPDNWVLPAKNVTALSRIAGGPRGLPGNDKSGEYWCRQNPWRSTCFRQTAWRSGSVATGPVGGRLLLTAAWV